MSRIPETGRVTDFGGVRAEKAGGTAGLRGLVGAPPFVGGFWNSRL
jgi:hypothetical protein